MQLTVTFKLGANLDDAQVLVQNRVSQANPALPEELRPLSRRLAGQRRTVTCTVE